MAPTTSSDNEMFRSSLQFQSNDAFQEHLKDRSAKIRSAITDIFGRIPTATPEIKDLQERMAALLANEKAHIVECQRIIGERDQLTQRLEQASYRYLLAEKKVDRAKSGPVHKMESRAIMGGYSESGPAKQKNSSKTADSADTNGNIDPSVRAANEAALKEATALAETRKSQTEKLESENKRLTEDLTAAQTRLTSFTDDDYAKTDLFKLLKSQHEDVIKRVNDLEATNVQLREEAQKLQGERTAYRTQLEEETRAAQSDLESQLARTETDLARIRNIRDELQGDVNVRAAQQEQQTLSTEQAKELAGASQNRIVALESELERLRLQLGESLAASATSLDDLDTDALKLKVRTLESQYALLEKELPSMEAAWRKTQALATKKVAEIAAWEEQKSRLLGEKAKADQKYFSAMKAKESRDGELRMLKAQNARSSEMVSQLKENEGSSRTLVANLEKQLSESKDSLTSLSHQNRSLQQKISDITTKLESSKTEVAGLKKLMVEKDSASSAAASSKRDAEIELKKMEANLAKMKKELQSAKQNNAGVSSNDDPDHWRVSKDRSCNFLVKALKLTFFHSVSLFVQSAMCTSATTCSKHAATSFVKIALRPSSETVIENALYAIGHLVTETICRSS